MIKIPYGISDFATLIKGQYYFVDKTQMIEALEQLDTRYHFLLRPRRFGKSLFVSMLKYYYGMEHKGRFEELFGDLYIGKKPTPKAGSYQILYFEFSRINTQTAESTFGGFLSNVVAGVQNFFNRYPSFPEKEREYILSRPTPAEVLLHLFSSHEKYGEAPIYLLIDEYDHFANEILAFNFTSFPDMVSRNGFVRKFYEAIKTATGSNTVEQLFVTGVTPITLDSLTSGFNIRTDLSRDFRFSEAMGFTEEEVREIVRGLCQGKDCDQEQMMMDLRQWYNGYRFANKASKKVYNPDMVLYFAKEFKADDTYPKNMIDHNIASDYGKIKGLFNLQNPDLNYQVLETMVRGERLSFEITESFSFERDFIQADFASLLYYMGFLTIQGDELDGTILGVPNYVIWRLYVSFIGEQLSKRAQLDIQTWDGRKAMLDLAQRNNPQPLFDKLQETLKRLSTRDAIRFDEKHLKMVFVALVNMVNIYYIRSEPEVEKKYADLMLLERKPLKPNYQFAFEFKYLKKEHRKKAPAVMEEAKAQLKKYLQAEEWAGRDNLVGYAVVLVYDEVFGVERV